LDTVTLVEQVLHHHQMLTVLVAVELDGLIMVRLDQVLQEVVVALVVAAVVELAALEQQWELAVLVELD
jgi:hypothetical protein